MNAPPAPGLRLHHSPLIKAGGAALPARVLDLLVSMRVDRGFGLVGRAVLRFDDPELQLATERTLSLGTSVEVTTYPDAEVLIRGEVTAVAMEASEAGTIEYTVTVDDAAARLRAPMVPQASLNKKAVAVLESQASAVNVKTRITAAALGSVVHDYLLQIGTPLAYLEAVTARTGAVWWVEGDVLRVEPASYVGTSVALDLGEELTSFSVRASAGGPTSVEVRGWDNQRKQPVVSKADSRPVEESHFVRGAHGRTGNQQPRSTSRIHQAAPVDAVEARELATAALGEATRASVVARGTCLGTGGLAPGVTIAVNRAGPANGSYRVTRVEHVYSGRGLRTHFTAGPDRPADLVDTLGPASADPGMHLHGMHVGVVTNNKDPLKMGRVKVKIPDLSDEVESQWARVATIGGGAGRGIFFTPEINDEVLVAFEHGDTRRPLVLGGLFSEKDKTPVEAVTGGDVTKRHIASRRGHVIELSDDKTAKAKESYVLLKNVDGAALRLGGDETTIDSGGQPLTITGPSGSSIAIDAKGNIALSGVDITIKASGNLTVEGLAVTAKAKTNLQLEASAKAGLKGAVTAVEASGITEVKGSLVKIN